MLFRSAEVSQVGGAIVGRDMQKGARARQALMALDPEDVVERLQTAGNLYAHGTLDLWGTKQSPDDFVKQQSATTGLPEALCRANMHKNLFVLSNMDRMLDALSRGLPPEIFWKGFGREHRRHRRPSLRTSRLPHHHRLRCRPVPVRWPAHHLPRPVGRPYRPAGRP